MTTFAHFQLQSIPKMFAPLVTFEKTKKTSSIVPDADFFVRHVEDHAKRFGSFTLTTANISLTSRVVFPQKRAHTFDLKVFLRLVASKNRIPIVHLQRLLDHKNFEVFASSRFMNAFLQSRRRGDQGQKNLEDDQLYGFFLEEPLKDLAREIPHLKESPFVFSDCLYKSRKSDKKKKSSPCKVLHFSLEWEWTLLDQSKNTRLRKVSSFQGKILTMNKRRKDLFFARFMKQMPFDMVSLCKAFFSCVTLTN